jgi:putative phosphonate metabolism protein
MRYALYFAPRDTALLARLGARWLGRDALDGKALQQPPIERVDAETFSAATASPRRYGFHATLKAPIRLAEGTTEAAFLTAVGEFAATLAPVTIPALEVARIGGFLALVPTGPVPPIEALAQRAVEAVDHFRRPPDETELARRGHAHLTPRQRELLARWGYPYVAEEFRFHMTLTDAIDDGLAAALRPAAEAFFAPVLGRPVVVDALTVFLEPDPAAPFVVHAVIPLGRRAAGAARAAAFVGERP